MENPPAPPPNWNQKAADLRVKFTDGTILESTVEELEFDLLVIANSSWDAFMAQDRERYAVVVRQLIELRLTREMDVKASKSGKVSRYIAIAAALISFLSLIATAAKHTVNNIPVPSVTNNIQAPIVTNNISVPPASTVITNIIQVK